MTSAPYKLSVVIPVYKEEENIREFINRIIPLLESGSMDFELIFCLDPSPDNSANIILDHHAIDPRIKLIAFSRRIGQPMATLAGLHHASGAAVVVMDVDMQDPPELILDMIAKWREGYDVVLARRRTRAGEPLLRKIAARAAYWVMSRIAEVDIPENTGDFRLLSRRVVDEINNLKECHGFLRGMVSYVGFRQTTLLFDRPARFAGNTNYPVLGSLRIGLNGLLCYSTSALRLSSMLGLLLICIFSISAISWLVLLFTGVTSLCYPLVPILLCLLSGVQLVCLGIVGEYIARIYDEVRQRPKFIIDRKVGF